MPDPAADGLDDLGIEEHAGLGGIDPDIGGDGVDLCLHEGGGNTVDAGDAEGVLGGESGDGEVPWTPRAAKVLRSAWMPAPPPESEPAMVMAVFTLRPLGST